MDRVELFEKHAHKIALLADNFESEIINNNDNPLELLVKTADFTLFEMDKFLLIEEPTDEEMLKYINDTAKLVQLGMLGHQYTLGGEVNCVGLAKQMSDTYRKKNADYGDSFSASIDRYGSLAAHVRMCDKVNRLQSLVVRKQTAQVKDESIADTFLDLACYAVMRLVYIEMKSSEQEEE